MEKIEPAIVGRFFAALDVLEVDALVGAVVEYPIKEPPHATLARLHDQLAKVVFIPKLWINFGVIKGIVAVVAGRSEYGGHVDAGHAQVTNVIELVDDAAQVPAEEIATLRW